MIFTVYREYAGISRPKKANLAGVTQRIICPPPLSFSLDCLYEDNEKSLEEKRQLNNQLNKHQGLNISLDLELVAQFLARLL